MLYRSHLAAGTAAGALAAAAAGITGAAATLQEGAIIGGLCLGFSLLPDLDVASVVQRWFYRAMLALLALWIFRGQFQPAAVLGAVCLLPLVHHHRGWMHTWWAALLVPCAALLLWDGTALRGALQVGAIQDAAAQGFRALAPGTIAGTAREVMAGRGWYFAAMAGGYAVHLAVDYYAPARWGRRNRT